MDKISETLSLESGLTDYELWRALKVLEDELYVLCRTREPIPLEKIRLRKILREARRQRMAAKV